MHLRRDLRAGVLDVSNGECGAEVPDFGRKLVEIRAHALRVLAVALFVDGYDSRIGEGHITIGVLAGNRCAHAIIERFQVFLVAGKRGLLTGQGEQGAGKYRAERDHRISPEVCGGRIEEMWPQAAGSKEV